MSDYATLDAQVTSLLQVPSSVTYLNATDHENAMREALSQYDFDAPRIVVEDLAGDGSAYDFALSSTNFLAGYSSVRMVEYPANERPALYLDPSDDYELYVTSSTTKLRLRFQTPSAGETVRVTYSSRHTILDLDGASATTVALWHEQAICRLAASYLLDRLANAFIHEQGGSALSVDVVDRTTKSAQAASRARALEADYKAALNVRGGVPAAGVTVDWDTTFAGSGLDYLTHPRKWR